MSFMDSITWVAMDLQRGNIFLSVLSKLVTK